MNEPHYISIAFDAMPPLYVWEKLGFAGYPSRGASLNDLLENLAHVIELVENHRAEVTWVYVDLDYPSSTDMARKSILVSAMRYKKTSITFSCSPIKNSEE